jgi:hypothetical protein
MHQCRRRPARRRARDQESGKRTLRLVIDVVMVDGDVRRRAVPQRNGSRRVRTEPHASYRLAYEIGDAAARPLGHIVQGLELFVSEIDLRLNHGCHLTRANDTRQRARDVGVAGSSPAGRASRLRSQLNPGELRRIRAQVLLRAEAPVCPSKRIARRRKERRRAGRTNFKHQLHRRRAKAAIRTPTIQPLLSDSDIFAR